ncbi:MAG: acyl-CoA thioesterase [Burkholderiaceae bacterium]
MPTTPHLDQYPLKSYEKLRYADTDRQGHVNNAIFATMFETGRVELFYDRDKPLTSDNCAFVVANLTLNYRGEINWPGRVDIGTRVSAIGRSSVTVEQALFQNGRCVADGHTIVVQMNETTRRSQALNETASAHLAALMPTSPPTPAA